MNIRNGSLTKLVALVVSLGFTQEAACAGKTVRNAAPAGIITSEVVGARARTSGRVATRMQNVELAAAVVGLPVAVLANNAEKSNTRSSHILKMVDDLVVIAGQGVSVYNQTREDVNFKDSLRYKALEIFFRGADLAKHATVLAKKDSAVVAEADDAEVTEMRKKLILSATVLRNLVAPIVQAAARGYVAWNTEDTKDASKKRLMVESLAFLTNRLSDYVASPKASLESDFQLVATMAGVVMLLVDYNRDSKKTKKLVKNNVNRKDAGETFSVEEDDNGNLVKKSKRARKPVVRFAAGA